MTDEGKLAAARKAAALVQDGMVVGLGTGSTASLAIRALGERVRAGLSIRAAVSSSVASENLAREVGIVVTPFGELSGPVDMTIDGADEVDPAFRLIKGGGGALVREKLLAVASREMTVVVDSSKVVATLGAFPLPVAVFPYSHERTLERLRAVAPVTLRQVGGQTYVTDDGLYVADLAMGRIDDPEGLYCTLRLMPGVADAGLFMGLATRVVVGHPDGRAEFLERG